MAADGELLEIARRDRQIDQADADVEREKIEIDAVLDDPLVGQAVEAGAGVECLPACRRERIAAVDVQAAVQEVSGFLRPFLSVRIAGAASQSAAALLEAFLEQYDVGRVAGLAPRGEDGRDASEASVAVRERPRKILDIVGQDPEDGGPVLRSVGRRLYRA